MSISTVSSVGSPYQQDIQNLRNTQRQAGQRVDAENDGDADDGAAAAAPPNAVGGTLDTQA